MLKKTKIVHIITRLDKGGSSENVLLTCQNLDKNKYEPVLIYGLSQSTENKLPIKNYRVEQLVREISPLKDIIAFLKIYKIIKKEKPDIVHTHSSKAGFIGRWSAWFYNFFSVVSHHSSVITKIVHTPHGHVFYGYFGKIKSMFFLLLEKITVKITDKLVALTEGEKNESLKFGVGKPNQWVVVHSGVNNPPVSPFRKGGLERDFNKGGLEGDFNKMGIRKKDFGIPESAIVIGTVARLEPVKGVKYFIDAIKIIVAQFIEQNNMPDKSGNYKFLIVGDGSERKILEKEIEKSGLKDKVIFTGMRDDVLDLISIMDIYVQPSLNEGMGKTLVQASLFSKPIIATKVQGIPDVVIDGKTGLLVLPARPDLLAEAIVKLIKDENLRKKIGENAYQYVNEKIDGYSRFSIERMIFLLEELYKSIL